MRDRLRENKKLDGKFVCDRCGKTCPSSRNDHKILDQEYVIPIYTDSLFSRLDLCEKCQEEFAAFWNKKRKQRIKGFAVYDKVTHEDWKYITPKEDRIKARANFILKCYFGVGSITKLEDLGLELIAKVYERAKEEIEAEG